MDNLTNPIPSEQELNQHEIDDEEDQVYNAKLFDGRFLRRRMANFLQRVNEGLREAQQHLPDFDIVAIEVSSVVGIDGNVSFPMAGGGASLSRTITFNLKPKAKEKSDVSSDLP